ncbi:uncharacterized protein B0H18DRAFT_1124277 [Fomitopsis serialis]|uniref:uncharacterized protein n=1 Tax=Fomitopsis serialis TaxID=139415 RepID=UPI002008C9F9|nr:uncharacterized protein B0H18DRAFT_1124277 [Neoantrodia serialis]KAH9916364.1 hypothetical protein B0H18DRAFT_1124277 [Neoantrodia serialis]
MLRVLSQLSWTLGEFLYNLFRSKDDNGEKIQRDEPHRTMIARFLSGNTKHTFVEMVQAIMEDTAGLPKQSDDESTYMYSQNHPSLEIKHARPALTTMAVELVTKEMVREMNTTVKSVNGLHGSAVPLRRGGRMHLRWQDISTSTVETTKTILSTHSPLAFHFLLRLATPPARTATDTQSPEGVVIATRRIRPPKLTVTEVLSDVAYCRTYSARLLPVARGILYFACGAQLSLFNYNSRTGHTPSWSTVIATLKRLADSAREELREMGKSETQALVMRMDNVQKYRKQREQRIGRRNEMDVGLAATVAEAKDFTADALDLGDKLRRIAENERSTLTVPKLLNMIDLDHYETVSALQWLQTLVYSIPQLNCHKSALEKLNKTEGAKLRVPKQKTALHPLATTRKNENVMTELRDALVDFMEQVGQEEEDYQQRLLFIGGDGLTFERLQQIKQYLDDQTTAYRRFDIIMPFLEIWHTIWTHLSSVFETHWGNELTKDPSKLGHSAHKIGQKTPSNLKKVDYYAASHLLYLVLDTRILIAGGEHVRLFS